MMAFHSKSKEGPAGVLMGKLKELPVVDGHPDLSQLGDPTEVAKHWVAEAKMSEEEMLVELLGDLGQSTQK